MTPMKKAELRVLEKAELCVPDTWLDSLLTGQNAVIGKPPYTCADIERLCHAIRKRIAALAKRSKR